MGVEIQKVRPVSKNYGIRTYGGAHGQYKSIGPVKTLSFKMDLKFLKEAAAGAAALSTYVPKGASIKSAKVYVHKAFHSTTAITFTGSNSQGTFPVAAGKLNTVGAADITPTGKFAVGKLTDQVGVITATGVTAGTVEGEAELLIEYVQTAL